METFETIYQLVRPARKSGGDRYESTDDQCPVKVIYVEQSFSRVAGTPAGEIAVTFSRGG